MLYSTPRLWDENDTTEAALRREIRALSDDNRATHAALEQINKLARAALKVIVNPTCT